MNIQENIQLAKYTTFKIGGPARFFCAVDTDDRLLEAVRFAGERKLDCFVLGGGSNILISDEGFHGMVIKMEMKGIGLEVSPHEVTPPSSAVISAAAGEQWDDVVEYAVSHGLYGIENLSAIPGTAGAAPVQNIGAYGAELARTVQSVRVLDRKTMEFMDMPNAACAFGYRDSVFKHDKCRYVITRVDLKLSRGGKTNIEYKDLNKYFSEGKGKDKEPTLLAVRDAVIDIRWNKLPDWKLWGTAGSYFKNCVIDNAKFQELKAKYPEMPGYPDPGGKVKLPLGWILDRVCGVRGLTMGNVGTYEKQALVVVAKPGATAAEVVAFTRDLIRRVKAATGLDVEGEVEWVN